MFKVVYCIGEYEKMCVVKIIMRKKNVFWEECRLIIFRMEFMRFFV